MKFIAFILFLCVCIEAYAANPTFNSFDTNAFIVNLSSNTIQANTSSGNPNALVKQSQITAGGISQATATNIAAYQIGLSNANYILSKNGGGTNNALTNMLHYGRASFEPIGGVGLGQIGVDSIDVQNQSDMSITAEAQNNFVTIKVGGFKVSNSADQFIVDGSSSIIYGNGTGITNLYGTNIIAGTLPKSAADSSWPVLTNTTLLNGVSNILGYIGNTGGGAPIFSPTNSLSVTNSMASLTIDFGVDVASTNMSGNVTISSVANLQPTVRNHVIRTFYPGGSDRSFTFASNIHTNPGSVYWCSNAYDHVDLLFTCRQGRDTNVAILPYQ